MRERPTAPKTEEGLTAMTANTRGKVVPSTRKPTTVAQWKQQQQAPVELPSGNYMRIRKISMQSLLATGKLPNSLMGLVQSAVDKGTGREEVMEKLGTVMDDEKKLQELVTFMESFVVMVSVEPKVHAIPEDEDDRDPNLLYVDDIDEDDRTYLFQLCTGGVADLESFRTATAATMAAVLGREDVVVPAVGATPAS